MQIQIDRKLEVEHFLQGSDPEEHIVKMECGYDDDHVTVFYRDANGEKKIRKDEFRPFCWCTERAALELYRRKEKPGEVNRDGIKEKLAEYGMACKGLRVANDEGFIPERMANGHKILFYAIRPMSYSKFMEFFKKGGVPIYPREKDANYGRRDFQTASPIEQYMISTGKRMFKGYEDYDDLVRLEWDLETEGLDPHIRAISQIGIRTNKGFEKIITVDGDTRDEKLDNEMRAIEEMFSIVCDLDPDVMTGHNTENFDWVFIDERLKLRGSGLFEFAKKYFPNGIYKKKKKAVLKLGGEVEYYNPTVFYGVNITDSLHAVRRAQALDSTMKKADLKYVTKFSKLNKANRVYVPGKLINKTWEVLETNYAFNNENGDWHLITDKKPLTEGYERVSGRYIVQRYLLDDLYEGDKVELQYNQSNFLVGKMLPLSFERACTMGTAGIWKYIMMAWSYEHNLAIPEAEPSRQFTGGLSRLIKVGFVDNVAKLDYNSLYPSIILSFGIKIAVDITDAMLSMLEYILTQREYYKGLKKKYGKEVDKYENEKETLIKRLRELPEYAQLSDGDFGKTVAKHDGVRDLATKIKEAKQLKVKYDKLQLPLKILGNSWFGSASSGVFPWDDINVGEETTCTGRMMFRLLIHFFEGIGYQAIVGDTDGINFKISDNLRYTDEHPYISNGAGRNSVKGKAYTGVAADVREFEDTYLFGKNGLDIDEVVPASINFKRKTYADLLEDNSVKLVGNTIKSKKMPIYIEKFLDKAIRMLLEGRGKDFLEYYYDYVERIYNYQIPLKDIASVGKIKISIDSYKEECKKLTKAGTKKSRQAWYELAIKHNLNVNMGDAIYYINTGDKKNVSDVQRITKYYVNGTGSLFGGEGEKCDMTKTYIGEYNKIKKLFKENKLPENLSRMYVVGEEDERTVVKLDEYVEIAHPEAFGVDELVFNCIMLPNDIVEDEEDHFCDETFEYNVEKYINMFNSRISTLLVCFHPDMRYTYNEKGKKISNILITNPKDRKYFTEEQAVMTSGFPDDEKDQDKIENVMMLEDKEIRFWTSVGKKPPYIDECGIDWENVKRDYFERMEKLKEDGIRQEVEKYQKAVSGLTEKDIKEFIEEGEIPSSILKIVYPDVATNNFISKKYDIAIGSLYDIVDYQTFEDEEESAGDEEL